MMELTSPSSPIGEIRGSYETVLNLTADCIMGMIFKKDQSATNIWKYFSPVLIVCGTVGNALSIAVFRLTEMRSLTITRQLIALAVLDIVVLTFTLTPKWLNFGLELISYPENNSLGYAWQIQMWLAQSIGMVDHWLMVFVSIERAFSVFRPLSTWVGRYESMSGRIWFGTLCLVCVLLNSDIIYDFVWHAMKQKESGMDNAFGYRICWLNPDHKRAMEIWRVWTMVITFLLPFLFIVPINTAILCKLRARYGTQWFREETQQKRANAATGRVNMALDDEVDRRKKEHSEREGREIEEEGEATEKDSATKRKRIEGKKEAQGSVRLEKKEIKEGENREEKQAKDGTSREEKKLVDGKPFHIHFDGPAGCRSSTSGCQAQRNMRAHLVVNFIFLATDLPLVVYLSVFYFLNIRIASNSFLMYTICDHMMYLRHTFSFFVFAISEQFQKAILRLITKCTIKKTSGNQGRLMMPLGDQKYLP